MIQNFKKFSALLVHRTESFIKTDLVYFLKGGFWINSNYIINSFFFLILSILFANFVSKDIFGIYKYIISITAIAGVFSLTGMNVAVMRAVAQGFDGIFKKSLIEQFKWSWPQFFFLLSFGAYYLYQNNLTYGLAFLIISIFAPLSGIANTYNAVLYGKKDFRISAFYGFWSGILYFSLMSVLILKMPFSVIVLIMGYYIPPAIANIYFCIRIYRKYGMQKDNSFRKEDILYGKHVSIMSAVGTLANQLDNILVYHLLGPASLALYSFATIIPERIRTFFSFIATLAFPKIAEKGHNISNLNLNKKIIQLMALGLIVAGIYIPLAPFLFHWLFPEYNSVILYSQIFSLSLVSIATNISNTTLLAQRKQKELYHVNTIVPIIKIIFTITGIWYFGIWGAIISKMFSQILLLMFSSYYLLKK